MPEVKAHFDLFGFQDGPEGFVQFGIDPPVDYTFLRVRGGRRSGKTRGGSLRALTFMAAFPGSRGIVTAPTGHIWEQATWPSIQDTLAKAGLRQNVHWEFNLTRMEFTLRNGSGFWARTTEEVRSLEDAKLPGADLAWFWMDEDRLSPEAAFLALQPALTQNDIPGLVHSAWLTSTPSGKGHWSRKYFLPQQWAEDFDEELFVPEAGVYRNYFAKTADNPYLPAQAIKVLRETYKGALALQELEGEEIVTQNLRFDVWDRARLVPREQWPNPYPEKVIAGVDFGHTHPSAILVEGFDGPDRYLMDCFRKPKLDEKTLIEQARNMMNEHRIKMFFADSADPRWIKAMRAAGLPVRNAKKSLGSTGDPSSGFGLCYVALTRTNDGRPAFFVDPQRCKLWVQEVEGMVEESKRGAPYSNEMPRNQRDDLVACWRYSEMAIEKLQRIGNARGGSLPFSVAA